MDKLLVINLVQKGIRLLSEPDKKTMWWKEDLIKQSSPKQFSIGN